MIPAFFSSKPFSAEAAGSVRGARLWTAKLLLTCFLSFRSWSEAFPVCRESRCAGSTVTVHHAEDRSAVLYSSSGMFRVHKQKQYRFTGPFWQSQPLF